MCQETFPNSRFDSLWYSGDTVCDVPCSVRIGDGHIVVTYVDGGEVYRYSGSERGDGHFELACPQIPGRATLHMFSNARQMVGYFVEKPDHGMWRIHLG